MDPHGCLANSGDGLGEPVGGAGFLGAACSFVVLSVLSMRYVTRTSRGTTPTAESLASNKTYYRIIGDRTVLMLGVLCLAFNLPQIAVFMFLTVLNGHERATALADMACVTGNGFPIVAALLGGVGIAFVALSPLRALNRHRLARAVVHGSSTVNAALIAPVGRGVYVLPIFNALQQKLTSSDALETGTNGSGRLTIVACDTFGTVHCPDSAAWLRHNVDVELTGKQGNHDSQGGVDVKVKQIDFREEQPCRFPAADGSVDLVFLPHVWGSRSDAIPGENAAKRNQRIQSMLVEARRVATPGSGRVVALLPFTKRKTAVAAMTTAGLDNAQAIPGLHYLSLVPFALVEASAPVSSPPPTPRDSEAAFVLSRLSSIDDTSITGDESIFQPCETGLSESAPWTQRTSLRLAVFSLIFVAVTVIMGTCLWLLSQHWQDVGYAFPAAAGIPQQYRFANLSVSIQINIVVGLMMTLHGAWSTARQREISAHSEQQLLHSNGTAFKGVRLGAGMSLLDGDRPKIPLFCGLMKVDEPEAGSLGGWTGLLSELSSSATALLFSLLGTFVITGIQWLPVFLVDLLWLQVVPPSGASTKAMTTVNDVISAAVPFVFIQWASSRAEQARPPSSVPAEAAKVSGAATGGNADGAADTMTESDSEREVHAVEGQAAVLVLRQARVKHLQA